VHGSVDAFSIAGYVYFRVIFWEFFNLTLGSEEGTAVLPTGGMTMLQHDYRYFGGDGDQRTPAIQASYASLASRREASAGGDRLKNLSTTAAELDNYQKPNQCSQ